MRGYHPLAALAELIDVDDSQAQQAVSYHGLQGEQHSGVYRPQPFGFSSSPPKGSTGLVVSLGGERSRAVFLGGESGRPTGLNPGDAKLYDSAGNIIYFAGKNGVQITTNKGDTTVSTPNGTVLIDANGHAYVHSVKGNVYLASKDGKNTYAVSTVNGPSSKVFAAL
jgi:phage baseplate assembly protein V